MAVFKSGAFIVAAVSLAVLAAVVAVPRQQQDLIEFPNKAVISKTLDNGLVVLAKRSPPRGLVAIDVKILAGSSLEGEYLASGISHLVEHMVFKGTKTRKPGDIEREIKSYGGVINGSTSPDITDYHLLVSPEYLPQGLAIIKDMLANAVFDETELAKEKEVVLKEINLNEDDPASRIIKRLNEKSYMRHPYRYPTIGYAERLKALDRADLIKFYDRMYTPGSMVLSIVGDIDERDAMAKALSEFADFRKPSYGSIPTLAEEPPQLESRVLEEDSRANLSYLAMGFHSTGILDKDLFAMDVLAMILGRGDSSRLNRSLVKRDRLAYSVSAWNNTPRDPGLFMITATLDKANAAKAEEAIKKEISRLREEPVSDHEIAAARRMVTADFVSSLETLDAQANDIGLSFILTGSPGFSRRYVKGIQSVTKEDLRRAARRYLEEDNLTIVRLLSGPANDAAAAVESSQEEAITKSILPNGLRVLLRRDTRTPAVSITAVMLGGLMAEDKQDNGISNFVSQMLLKGTKTRGEDKIAGPIESMGGSIAAFSGLNSFGIRADVLKPDMAMALDTIGDILTGSDFPQYEIDRQRDLIFAAIKEEDDDIFATGFNALRKTVFHDSPYGMRYIGEVQSVKSITREDLVSFYSKYVAPENMVLSISGDIDMGKTLSMIRSRFSAMKPSKSSVPRPGGRRLDKISSKTIRMDKDQSLVLIGFETTSMLSPDRYSLEVLSSVLSGSSGRLFEDLRNQLALSYALGCAQKFGLGRGYFALYAATTSEKLDVAKKALISEIAKVVSLGITDEELSTAKKELRTTRAVERQTNGFYSLNAALDELYGLGHDNLYKYDDRIDKVTAEDVKAVARKYFDLEAYAEVAVLPQP